LTSVTGIARRRWWQDPIGRDLLGRYNFHPTIKPGNLPGFFLRQTFFGA
jgi:hypothetical protein